ncbi:MAG TPA: carbon storage regulator [Gemmataceae bacterium]|jgi:carbon storage regulator|nr:carbon storage regulator [Gemmataceae bacterium]
MLVLTRRTGEEIVINGNIRVTINAIKGERVRLGIVAPDFVRVDRQEIHDQREQAWTEGSVAAAPAGSLGR